MEKKEILASLQNMADELDESGLFSEATTLTNVMQKLAYESYDYAAENGMDDPMDDPMDNIVEAVSDDEEDQDGIDQEIYKKMFDQFSNIINK
jgi:uncharacterized protein Yka (UPF0111/DUF47 family)